MQSIEARVQKYLVVQLAVIEPGWYRDFAKRTENGEANPSRYTAVRIADGLIRGLNWCDFIRNGMAHRPEHIKEFLIDAVIAQPLDAYALLGKKIEPRKVEVRNQLAGNITRMLFEAFEIEDLSGLKNANPSDWSADREWSYKHGQPHDQVVSRVPVPAFCLPEVLTRKATLG